MTVRRRGGVEDGRCRLHPVLAAAAAATMAERLGGVKVRKVDVRGGEGGMMRLPTWPLLTMGAGWESERLPGGVTCGP